MKNPSLDFPSALPALILLPHVSSSPKTNSLQPFKLFIKVRRQESVCADRFRVQDGPC